MPIRQIMLATLCLSSLTPALAQPFPGITPGASGTGSASASGGGPFQSVQLPITATGATFDTGQQEAELDRGGQGEAAGGARLSASVASGRLGWSAGATADAGGFVFASRGLAQVGYLAEYQITSPTLAPGTPVDIDFKLMISITETIVHTNGPIAAPQSSTNSGDVSFDLRTVGAIAQRWRESGVRNNSNSRTEPQFFGNQNGQSLGQGQGSLHEDLGRSVTIRGVVGGTLRLSLQYTARASVDVQFVDQRGRATLCGALGFGFSPPGDVELVPTNPATDPGPIPTELIDFDYVNRFTPPDPVGGCDLDLNNDGDIDIFDVIEFKRLHDLGDPAADWNGDNIIDRFDIEDFLIAFELECNQIIF
ncbi:MAG: hypothetical protein AAFR38_00725 [Planctomycetota bacterium]